MSPSPFSREHLAKRPPWELSAQVAFLIALALWNILRLVQALRYGPLLAEYQAHGGVLYLKISGLAWALLGLLLAWQIGKGSTWSWRITPICGAGFLSWKLIDWFVIQISKPTTAFFLLNLAFWSLFFFSLHFSQAVRTYCHER